MEINPLAAQYLNQSYIPFSNSTVAPADSAAGLSSPENRTDFMQMLERAANGAEAQSTAREEETPVLPSGKAHIDKTSELYEACLELEGFLLKTLINGMRKTVQKSELSDTSYAGSFYEDMLYDEYTKEFTKNAHFGFAEMAYLELTGQKGKYINQRVI
ncbi:MAG: rod-binding protein [Treponema sp.]|jgi:flagellar protein FlgJ|nr:rod-binding protein [Treponema sp.]